MKLKRLFEPGAIGKMEVRNRIVQMPMMLNYTEYPYNFTRRYIDCLEERAKGGVGLIITAHVKSESTIDPYGVRFMSGCLDRDYTLRTFAELVDAVHRHGAKIAVELSAGTGRYADATIADKWPVSASAVPIFGNPQLMTRELSLTEISGLVEAYGEAGRRAEQAGFDAIEVHCFGGYLVDQFLSPIWNKRTDKYGENLENRMRFMVECIENLKSKISAGFPLLARLTSDHRMDGGRTLNETIKIAKRLEELGINALHLSTGCYETTDWLIPPMYYPEGVEVPFAQPVREAVNIPIIVDGRIGTPEFAEKLLEEGKTDFIGLGRPLLADPWWPRKAKEGKTEEIRMCIYCNECLNTINMLKHAKCSINPALGREGEYKTLAASKPKKVVVIGGGPAGIQAATVAASRGHDVTLYEKADKLGGNLRAASAPSFKAPIKSLIDWLSKEIGKVNVKIELGKEATAKAVEELKPDVVIFATGASPATLDIPTVNGKNVVTAVDVLLGKARVGDEVIVAGGGMVGCEVALHLTQIGKRVTIVEMLPQIAADLGISEQLAMFKMLPQNKVSIFTNMKLVEVEEKGIIATNKDGQKQTFQADTIVLAVGMKSNEQLFKELKGKLVEVYKIGDALQPRKIINAIHEGDSVAHEI